jgi:hypothetical protein
MATFSAGDIAPMTTLAYKGAMLYRSSSDGEHARHDSFADVAYELSNMCQTLVQTQQYLQRSSLYQDVLGYCFQELTATIDPASVYDMAEYVKYTHYSY